METQRRPVAGGAWGGMPRRRKALAGACVCVALASRTAPVAAFRPVTAPWARIPLCRHERGEAACKIPRAFSGPAARLGAGPFTPSMPRSHGPATAARSRGAAARRGLWGGDDVTSAGGRVQMAAGTGADDGESVVAGAVDAGQFFRAAALLGVAVLAIYSRSDGGHALLSEEVEMLQRGVGQLSNFLQEKVDTIHDLGPLGPLYFGAIYVFAEILAIPAIPLTTSSGYLFGLVGGTAVTLVSGTIAAGVSFLLGRTLLRKWVEGLLEDNPKFQAVDRAIAKEGFKIILLLRLSPVFPFALSNYLYGLTAVDFWEYMAGTILGFFPGTLAYVYTGQVGKSLLAGDGGGVPWYVYGVGAALVAFLLKTAGDVATRAVEELEPDLADNNSASSGSEQDWS